MDVFSVTDIRLDKHFDIAVARVVDVTGHEALTLASEDAGQNLDVVSLEFSGTSPIRLANDIIALELGPYTRKGNIIRRRRYLRPGWPQPAMVQELSFPALKGASGAPVLVEPEGEVLGMIVDNVEHHLLSAHIETIIDDKGRVTETQRYFLPTALAIHWSHLKEFVESAPSE